MKDEALRLALEALGHFEKAGLATLKTIDAITAIKQALEQPEPEPFGYFRYDLRLDAWVQNRARITGTPFYTSPPKRKPLTDDELKPLIQQAMMYYGYKQENWIHTSGAGFYQLARAIEAAHGIKGEA